jgi:hypothetical protein
MAGEFLQFAVSLVAISMLVLVCARLGLGGAPIISSEQEARQLADNAICGFEAEGIALDERGAGALLRDPDGRILLLAPHGSRFIARLLEAGTQVDMSEAGSLQLRTTDPQLAMAQLQLGAVAPAWRHSIEQLG